MINQWIQTQLFKRGFLFERVTPTVEVSRLVERLSPVETNLKLIRVGDAGDGGYLIPEDLEGIRYCFSPGVYEVATFEKTLIDRGITCYLADRSVETPPIESERIHFQKKHLGVVNDDQFMTLSSWVERSVGVGEEDLMLQMDIERAEYTVLLDTPASILSRFRIVVAEFHDMHRVFDRSTFRFIDAVFEKLLSIFHVVHIHPNNFRPVVARDGLDVPPLMEMTFLRKDRADPIGPARKFPHPLDADNVPGKPSVVLPNCWMG
jgi:hypothetical protein